MTHAETEQSVFACLRKRKYDREREAWSAIFNMRARGQDTERVIPYRCEFCNRWHLGKTPPLMTEKTLREFERLAR